jgi:hypothetical protein
LLVDLASGDMIESPAPRPSCPLIGFVVLRPIADILLDSDNRKAQRRPALGRGDGGPGYPRLNIEHFRKLLATNIDDVKRQMVLRLLGEEEAKLAALDNPPAEKLRER